MKRSLLVDAARELNDKLGLDPEIDIKLATGKLREKVEHSITLIEEDDSFSDETTETLKTLGWDPDAEDEAGGEDEDDIEEEDDDDDAEDSAEEEEEEESSEPEPPAVASTSTKKSGGKKKTGGGAAVPSHKGSVAEVVDKLMLKAGTSGKPIKWDKLLEKSIAAADERGQKQLRTLGQLKQHARHRDKGSKYKVTMDDNGVSMVEA